MAVQELEQRVGFELGYALHLEELLLLLDEDGTGGFALKQVLRILRPQLIKMEHPLGTVLQLTAMQQIPHPRPIGEYQIDLMTPPQQRLNDLFESHPIIGPQQTITIINHQQHMLPVQLPGDTIETIIEAPLIGAGIENLIG